MREAPSVEAASRSAGRDTVIIGVGWSGDDSIYRDFIAEADLTFPQIDDTAGTVYARFDVPYQPALVVIDAEGNLVEKLGAVDEDDLTRLING
jgi:hypothetical protein